MVSLTCATDHRDGVTLVTARLEGAGAVQRVRLANRLDGPVWPPRRQGVAEDGWDGDRFETVVAADDTVALGYASPAPPRDPPLAVVDRTFLDGDAAEQAGAGTATAADALRDLGDPSPPRDAVPLPSTDPSTATEQSTNSRTAQSPRPGTERSARDSPPDATCSTIGDVDEAGTDGPDGAPPAAVTTWLDDVEERLAVADQLAGAETLPEATAAVREAGGLDATERLVETLRDDAEDLEAVADRAARLADRTAATDVPLETFERLA